MGKGARVRGGEKYSRRERERGRERRERERKRETSDPLYLPLEYKIRKIPCNCLSGRLV